MADLTKERETLRSMIRSLIVSSNKFPGGLSAKYIDRDYRLIVGSPVPYWTFGYNSLEDLLIDMPDVVEPMQDSEGYLVFRGVITANIHHIADLISRTKPKTNNRLRGGRSCTRYSSPFKPYRGFQQQTALYERFFSQSKENSSVPQRSLLGQGQFQPRGQQKRVQPPFPRTYASQTHSNSCQLQKIVSPAIPSLLKQIFPLQIISPQDQSCQIISPQNIAPENDLAPAIRPVSLALMPSLPATRLMSSHTIASQNVVSTSKKIQSVLEDSEPNISSARRYLPPAISEDRFYSSYEEVACSLQQLLNVSPPHSPSFDDPSIVALSSDAPSGTVPTTILRGEIRTLLFAYPTGVPIENFPSAFGLRFGRFLDLAKIGFSSYLELIQSMPDVADVKLSPVTGDYIIRGKFGLKGRICKSSK